jgi:hypothetical protein
MFLAAQMTSSSFEGAGVQHPNWEEGQSTVEAAVLLPTVFVLLALLVQPVCLLYTRTLMHGAAAETARAVLTARGSADLSACRHYALRRLAAVPDVSIFHVGGENDWQVEVQQSGGASVTVSVTGHARPLPFFAGIAAALHGRDASGVILQVSVTEHMRPDWVGGDYGDWVGLWG